MTGINETLAIHGGTPIRNTRLPYGQQWIDEEDIAAVVDVLQSGWLTTGPEVSKFEQAFAEFVGSQEAVAVSNGTAALHAAMYAIDIKAGDEVIVASMTFAASANCVLFQGGTPIFADVEEETLLINPEQVKTKITERTRAIITVDYAGQPCDYDALHEIANSYGLFLVADACHSLGATYKDCRVGTLATLNTFSLHPVKSITTGEGGIITTNDAELAQRMRRFRNHGINADYRLREKQQSWVYEIEDLGYNYRLTDIQCALGISQLRKLPQWIAFRQDIARRYDAAFSEISCIKPLRVRDDFSHAYHLYVIRLDLVQLRASRTEIFAALHAEGIGVNVHYIPVHFHPLYRNRLGTRPGLCPVAEAAYEHILTLPIFPRMSDNDVDDVLTAIHKVIRYYRK